MKRRKDGRLVKTVVDPRTRKRIYFYADTEREMNKKLLEFQIKSEHGRRFSEVADEWWSDVYDSFAAQTLRGYKPAYARAIEEFGDEFISDITPMDIQSMFKKMSTRGFFRKTIANQRIILNQIFNHAVVSGDIQYNPCTSVKIPAAKKSTVILPASTDDEQSILNSSHPWLFPKIALLTGLRKQEILALQWQDIDFTEKTISVTKAVEHLGKAPKIKSTKTSAGEREVPLLDKLSALLEAARPTNAKPEHYIFSDDGGKTPLSESSYERQYKEYSASVGISCTSRQLRHSYATVAVEEDVQPKDLQNALGHADISTTMNVYAAARKKSIDKVAIKLNNRYNK